MGEIGASDHRRAWPRRKTTWHHDELQDQRTPHDGALETHVDYAAPSCEASFYGRLREYALGGTVILTVVMHVKYDSGGLISVALSPMFLRNSSVDENESYYVERQSLMGVADMSTIPLCLGRTWLTCWLAKKTGWNFPVENDGTWPNCSSSLSLHNMASIGKLYGTSLSPKVLRIRAAAKVNGLNLEVVETAAVKDSYKPEFTSKFPLGQVPAFEGPDNFLLTESRAILRYGTYTTRGWMMAQDGEIFSYPWLNDMCRG